MDPQQVRNDAVVQDAVSKMFVGVAPERETELQEIWATNDLRFNVLPDNGRDGKFVFDAGLFKEIRFNHRAMRAFWVASFAAWEGYVCAYEERTDLSRFQALVDCVDEIINNADPESIPLPAGIPPVGMLDGLPVEQKAPADLSVFAAGWAFLHEVRHIKHQRQGTSSALHAPPAEQHDEELSCDEFATRFLLEHVGDYVAQAGVDPEKVMQKRQAGIYVALFAMALITLGHWSASSTHPSMQDRINRVVAVMEPLPLSLGAAAIAMGAFSTLGRLYADAPIIPIVAIAANT